MKKSFLCLLLAACLTGCAPAGDAVSTPANPARSSSAPSGASASAPTPPDAEPVSLLPQTADVPPGSYAPWQEAYASFLVQLREEECARSLWVDSASEAELSGDSQRWEEYAASSESYSLYDVDKDGIPELFVQYGTCEADYDTVCYTFRDGAVAHCGSFPSGHASLYTCPWKNAVLFHYGQMGHGSIETASLEGGRLGPWETLLSEGPEQTNDRGYTYPGDLVPGSQLIPSYYTCTQFRPVDSPALVLPVYDSQGREIPAPMEEAEVRAAIGAVLWEGGTFFGVSGDGFHGDTGLTTLEDYLQPEAAYPYGDQPLVLQRYAWADANGDGQTDCLLWLEQERGTWTDAFCVVLSAADSGVWAYFFDFITDVGVDPDGTVYFACSDDSWDRVSFFKNQCYRFPSPSPVEGAGLAWDSFS